MFHIFRQRQAILEEEPKVKRMATIVDREEPKDVFDEKLDDLNQKQ